MLALNLLNQFTRHFLKWTVCLLWLAPYVDDPSVTFIWMIFTFKMGNYSGLIMVMNGPLFFSCFFWSCSFSAFGIWRIWMFSDTSYFSGDIFAFPKIPTHAWLHRSYIDPVDNIFHNHPPLFRRYYSSWNKCTYILKWAYILIVLPKIQYSSVGIEDVRPRTESWFWRKHFWKCRQSPNSASFFTGTSEACYCMLPFVSKHKEKSEAIHLAYQYYSVWFLSSPFSFFFSYTELHFSQSVLSVWPDWVAGQVVKQN